VSMDYGSNHPEPDVSVNDPSAGNDPRQSLLALIRSGGHLNNYHPQPLRWAVPGVFPEGFALLAGAPKRGKSWLALDCCLAVALGGKALGGIEVAQGDVLYLALEDSDRRLKERAHVLLGGADIPDRFDYLTMLPEPYRLLQLLDEWCRAHPAARLIVIDTLARVRPPQPRNRGAYEWDHVTGMHLKTTADARGVTVVAVTHTRQLAAADFVEQVTGTSGLTGAADTIVVLDRARGQDDGKLRVTGRDAPEATYALRMVGGSWQLLNRPPVDPSLGHRSLAVLDLAASMPEGIRAADVAHKLEISEQMARTYLNRLADSERLARGERGLFYTRTVMNVMNPPHT
jgi:AAA domain